MPVFVYLRYRYLAVGVIAVPNRLVVVVEFAFKMISVFVGYILELGDVDVVPYL